MQFPRRTSPLANHWVAAGHYYDQHTGLVSPPPTPPTPPTPTPTPTREVLRLLLLLLLLLVLVLLPLLERLRRGSRSRSISTNPVPRAMARRNIPHAGGARGL